MYLTKAYILYWYDGELWVKILIGCISSFEIL